MQEIPLTSFNNIEVPKKEEEEKPFSLIWSNCGTAKVVPKDQSLELVGSLLPFVEHSRNKYTTAFWITLRILSLLIFFSQSYKLMQHYFSYDVNTSFFRLDNLSSIQFPQVVICSNNLLMKSKLKTAPKRDGTSTYQFYYMDQIHKEMLSKELGKCDPNSCNTANRLCQLDAVQCNGVIDCLDGRDEDNCTILDDRPPLLLYKNFLELLQLSSAGSFTDDETRKKITLDPSVVNAYGPLLEELLVQCTFAGENCNLDLPLSEYNNSDFTVRLSKVFGRCYSFNFNGDRHSHTKLYTDGFRGTIFVPPEEFIGILSGTGGAFLTVIDNNKIQSDMSMTPIQLSPGYLTQISVKKRITQKLKRPNFDCQSKFFSTTGTMIKTLESMGYHLPAYPHYIDTPFNSKYNQQTCLALCYAQEILLECECFDNYIVLIWNLDTFHPHTPARACGYDIDSEFYKCKAKMYKHLMRTKNACDCIESCEDVTYDLTITKNEFPSKEFLPYFVSEVLSENKSYVKNSLKAHVEDMEDFVERSFAKFEVYYSDLSIDIENESFTYTLPQLVSDIAANLGLWLGMSIITIFELAHLLFISIEYRFF